MYCDKNYPTKKALLADHKDGVPISVFQPGGLFPSPQDGSITLEGPHFPKPHRWYASAQIKNGLIVSVK